MGRDRGYKIILIRMSATDGVSVAFFDFYIIAIYGSTAIYDTNAKIINGIMTVRRQIHMRSEQKVLIDRINSLCKERGISYYALSYKAAVPLATILHIMNGTTKNPGIFTIIKLCEGLDTSLEEFFGVDDFRKMCRDDEDVCL